MNIQKPERLSPRNIPKELVMKYLKSGPRYTSYPTAPHFKSDFDEEKVKEEWSKTNYPKGNGLSLYVHIPFCAQRCLYCGCTTEAGHTMETAEQYVSALFKETERILQIIDHERSMEQLALGGGTPTFLKPGLMARLIQGLKERFRFAEAGERSIEIDPRTVDNDYLDLLSGIGFNRYSFGVQDLDPMVQKNVGRIQHEEKISELLSHLRKIGHNAINIDLIYGLPGQTPESFSRTIEKIIRLKPSRIALFGFAFVPWVSPHQKALEQYHIPNPEERMTLFGLAYDLLFDAGYEHIGMDHFALPEDELIRALKSRTLTRNFMGYTTRRGLDLIGIGASSISAVGATYAQNEKEVRKYMEKAETQTWVKTLLLSNEDLLRRELIIDLFCNFYLDISELEKKFGINFQEHFASELKELEGMQQDGLIQIARDYLKVTDMGRFFIRNICMTFDQYLKKDDARVRYSQTI
jgi:oxygen-independent coproporphyrinogen-3 oxidase